MIKKYKVGGMNCDHCRISVEKALSAVEGVTSASVDLGEAEAVLKVNKQIPVIDLQEALSEAGLYFIVEKESFDDRQSNGEIKKKPPFFRKFLKMFC